MLVILYFLALIARFDGIPVAVVLVVAPLILLLVSWWQIRAILRSSQPGLRGIEALAGLAPPPPAVRGGVSDGQCRGSFSMDELTA